MTDTLLHIGAGRGADIQYAIEAAKRNARVILVEANGENVEELREQVREFESVEVIQAALADRRGAGVLRVFNLDQCSSLREPDGLDEIFPGLKQVEALTVDMQDAGAFVAHLGVSGDGVNTLVIDAPGEELTILGSLEQAGLLSLFKQVEVHCGVAVHYEGAGDAGVIEAFLSKKAYRTRRESVNDPDFCRLKADRDEVLLDKTRLEKDLAKRDETIAALKQEAEGLQTELKKTRLELEERASRVDNLESDIVLSDESLQTLRSELTTVREKLAASRKDREALQQELQQMAERLQKLEEDAESRNVAFESARNDLETRNERIKSLLDELETTRQALTESEDNRRDADTALEDGRKRIRELEAALEELTAKNQAMAESEDSRAATSASLEDSRKRIEELEVAKGQLEADAKSLRNRISQQDQALADSSNRLTLYKMNLQGAEAQLDLLKQLMKRDANVGQ